MFLVDCQQDFDVFSVLSYWAVCDGLKKNTPEVETIRTAPACTSFQVFKVFCMYLFSLVTGLLNYLRLV